jgi:hypothetical protein
MRMIRALFLSFIIILGGCSAVSPAGSDYKFGETTLKTRQAYCSESDPVKRAFLLVAIRSSIENYPVDGVCTDLRVLMDD